MTRSGWVAVALAVPAAAFAQTLPEPPPENGLSEMLHARSYGMGGAYHALGIDGDVVDGNPASMMLFHHYLTDLGGSWDVQTKYAFATASIVDTTNAIGAGLSYHLVTLGRGADRTIANVTTGAAGYSLSDNIHIGATVKQATMSGAQHGDAVTADAGVAVRVLDSFTAAFSGHNLIPIPNPYLPRFFVLGFGYFATDVLTLAADLRGDFGVGGTTPFSFNFGGEYIAGSSFPLRAGYAFDTITHSHFVSGGLGFVSDGTGVDVAYRQEIGGERGKLVALTLKLQIN
jgi:hypothetical protein